VDSVIVVIAKITHAKSKIRHGSKYGIAKNLMQRTDRFMTSAEALQSG
jgi:hypothetical protein